MIRRKIYRKMEYEAILSETGGENQDFYVTKTVARIIMIQSQD